ncbi:MAG: cupin domain-containing protein [Gammaproteobacteria bacterium]
MKRNMTREEIAERTARFADLEKMNVPIDRDIASQDAMDVIFARSILPIIMEKTKNPFGDTGAIYGANGMTMNISVLPPGQGPCLHAHNATFETFLVLDGEITFHVGEPDKEEHVTLSKWDVFSCPPEAYRGFNNASTENEAVLLTVINGDVNARDDVNVPPQITEHLRSTYGESVLEEFKKVVKLPESET